MPFVWPCKSEVDNPSVSGRSDAVLCSTHFQGPLRVPTLSPISFNNQPFAIDMLPRLFGSSFVSFNTAILGIVIIASRCRIAIAATFRSAKFQSG